MQKFTQGDWVVRRGPSVGSVACGGRYYVDISTPAGWLGLRNLAGQALGGMYMDEQFELDAVSLFHDAPAGPKMHLSKDPVERKGTPITSGVLDYFPLAIAAVAQCSKVGNDQHNPGQPLHWDKEKSTDHADCIARHLIDRHTVDTDGVPHATKLAWRALALLQTMLEAEQHEHGHP